MNEQRKNSKAIAASVTTVVTRRVAPGREKEYRELFDEVVTLSKTFAGYQGATLQGPTESNEFHTIFRYDSVEHLQQWKESAARSEWMEKLRGIVLEDIRIDSYTGLEYLFSPSVPPLPKLKMTVVLIIVVFLMIHVVRSIVDTLFPDLNGSAQLLVTVVIQVTTMTYIVMPVVTRWLMTCSRWIKHRLS